jgi:hypothetical protein
MKKNLQCIRVITNGVFYVNHFVENDEPLKEGDKVQYDFFFEGEMHTILKDENGILQITIDSPLICTSKEEFEAKIQAGLDSAANDELLSSEEVIDRLRGRK